MTAVKFTLAPFDLFVLPTRTRFPFRYGIASMTDVPQVFVRAQVLSDGRRQTGLAAEGLPPKWFTKNPSTTFEQDLPEMLAAIRHATTVAAAVARQPVTFFDLWRELDRQQTAWAAARGMAPLLAHLGVSLVERAVLDALCRALGEPLHRLLRRDSLALDLGCDLSRAGCNPCRRVSAQGAARRVRRATYGRSWRSADGRRRHS